MAINLTLPQIGEKKTAKDYIILVLGEHWPLTAKKIYNLIRKRHGYSKTFQSVFKSLKELVTDGVLKEKKGEYLININWIDELHRMTEQVRSNYSTKERLTTVGGMIDSRVTDDITIISFETLFDAEKYLYYFEKNLLLKKGKTVICRHCSHDWKLLFYLRAEYNRMKLFQRDGAEVYTLCSGSTFLDKWTAGFYRGMGMHVKTGVRRGGLPEVECIGDYFIQMFIPEDINAALGKAFSSVNSINDMRPIDMIENILQRRSKIQIIINKNAQIADEVRGQVMRRFR